MKIKDYVEFTRSVSIYPNVGNNINYPGLGLIGEFGEIAEKLKKIIRDNNNVIEDEQKILIAKEFGDISFYIARIIDETNLFDYIDTIENDNYFDFENNIEIEYLNPLEIMGWVYKLEISRIAKIIENVEFFTPYSKEFNIKTMSSKIFKRFFKYKNTLYKEINQLFSNMNSYSYNLTGKNLIEIIDMNVTKLSDRKERKVLGGSGDNR